MHVIPARSPNSFGEFSQSLMDPSERLASVSASSLSIILKKLGSLLGCATGLAFPHAYISPTPLACANIEQWFEFRTDFHDMVILY